MSVLATANSAEITWHIYGLLIDLQIILPYSRKYWRELNLAVQPQITITRILVDLNLAVRYGIAIRIYASGKFWRLYYRPPNRQIFRLYQYN